MKFRQIKIKFWQKKTPKKQFRQKNKIRQKRKQKNSWRISFVQNVNKKSFVKNVTKKVSSKTLKKKFRQKRKKFLEDEFGKAKLIIGAANVICGEATWSLLIKTGFITAFSQFHSFWE